MLFGIQRYLEAEDLFQKAIIYDPRNGDIHSNYAEVLQKLERFSEAEKEIRIALEIDPCKPAYLCALGDIFIEEENFDDAIKVYNKALESPNTEKTLLSTIHNNLGWIYVQKGENHRLDLNLSRAKEEFIKAIELDGTNAKAQKNLRLLKKKYIRSSAFSTSRCDIIAFCLGLFLLIPIILFFSGKISDVMFTTMFLLLIAGFVGVFLSNEFSKFWVGPKGAGFERNIGYFKPPSNLITMSVSEQKFEQFTR